MSISELDPTLLSLQQVDTLKTLREQLFEEGILHEGDSIGTDDETLLQFLRARRFNLNETKKMVKNCQHWRQTVLDVGIDELINRTDLLNYPGRVEVFKSWPIYFHKTDKKGRPINIQYLGGINLPGLYKHITPEQLFEFLLVTAETLCHEMMPAASRAAGRHMEQALAITDLDGFGFSHFWQMKSLMQSLFQIMQDYYPEMLGQLAFINAPPSFTFIWSIIKPWLSKETQEKVMIIGKDYKDTLLQIVDADNLPTTLGGNCTCSDAGGCGLSNAGPWMEEMLAKRTTVKELCCAEPNACSMPDKTLSELIPSIIVHTGRVEQMNVIHEKVACNA